MARSLEEPDRADHQLMSSDMRADAKARADLVVAGTPMHTIAALYPSDERIDRYLREMCKLEPWVDALPTKYPEYWKMTALCDDGCHHPVHAFGNPERLSHLVDVPPFN